jgi:hypothetical protein
MTQRPRDGLCLVAPLIVILAAGGPAHGQALLPAPNDLGREPLVLRDPSFYASMARAALAAPGPRIQMFRMPTGFLSEPLGLDDDDTPTDLGNEPPNSDLDGRVGLAAGLDNPFFDFRRPGDPGGPGFYKVHTQYQLIDGKSTFVSLVLRAVTPAGLDADGVGSGLTVLSPSIAWYQEIDDGVAVQGFVGKDVPASSRWMASVERGFQYGLGLQAPLVASPVSQTQQVYLFIEALGCHHRFTLAESPANTWELLPGVHWRLTEDWWLSGGVSFPLGTSHFESKLWQITCSWEF